MQRPQSPSPRPTIEGPHETYAHPLIQSGNTTHLYLQALNSGLILVQSTIPRIEVPPMSQGERRIITNYLNAAEDLAFLFRRIPYPLGYIFNCNQKMTMELLTILHDANDIWTRRW